ncbi:NUDIX domain-containing protein [Herbiconiux sp. KACC 21604]|uniref:NUDIX hydrolase n=1 Tax=unclassified Herbiconiux TaxID=2618217 RepID=UPI0014929DAA|nr:NUDIX domain-containing protein [Herbiconiux sp. SALV-R1]QJU52494.1 NUDIX hydrolase [Herbiconiux sp. SALV-R1]WPO87369.1 NUDIX domain-containing protein [Herbiconiux sp. KACC 21604]
MTVFAAGAVCWRIVDDKVRVLVIHRTAHRDVSLPKGKVDPGETLPQTAVREIAEETGLSVHLGLPLGVTNYTMPNGREKVVHYWAAEVTEEAVNRSTFLPNGEVAALEWLPVKRAIAALTYERDAEIVERFRMLVEQGITRTFGIIALRHAKATPPYQYPGPDADRPLTERGLGEAKSIVPTLLAFGPQRLHTSTAKRCRQTVEPLAKRLGMTAKPTDAVSQDAWESGVSEVREFVGKRVRKRVTSVVCSHGPVLPDIVREVALATGTAPAATISRAGDLPVAGFSVLHLSVDRPGSGIITIETHVPG